MELLCRQTIHRQAAFSKDGTLKTSYRYNGHGERVIKRKNTAQGERTSVYHYAPHGRLIAETRYNTHGIKTTAREYLWLDDRPLAQITTRYKRDGSVKATELVYLHTDHLNTPRLATDQHQRVVWRWDVDAFGQGKADRDPDGDGHTVTIALRFPGQYKDRESGLHYNYFRDYDPNTGRYIESDPIGLEGGLNPYAYVLNNPLGFIDPLGLEGSPSGPGLFQMLFPANTAPISKQPVGGSVDAQLRYANTINQVRSMAFQSTALPYEFGVGGPSGAAAGGICKAFAKKNINKENIRKAACAAGFAAACTQGKLHELDNIADHIQTIQNVTRSSRLPQQTKHLPK